MKEKFVDVVYDLVNGVRIRKPDDPDVESLFTDGQVCERLYNEVYEANLRLCERLGVEEDRDVEVLINSLLKICERVGKRMYRYGAKYGRDC